jgi:hypothetical protein
MRIEFRQSGGVAGIARPPLKIDTASLPADEAQKWHDLVAAADVFELPPASPVGPRRDAFSYHIKVEEGGRSHIVQTHYGAGSPALDALLERLRQAALAAPKP